LTSEGEPHELIVALIERFVAAHDRMSRADPAIERDE
jgi:hypothetical protein